MDNKLKLKFLMKIFALIIIAYFLGTYLNIYSYLLNLEKYYSNILVLIILFIGTMIFLDISLELLRRFFEKKGELRDYPVVGSVFKYITWFTTILVAVSILYQGLGSLIMSLGLIGAGITFALQRPIMNFAGWVNIVVTRPFKINDRINIKGVGMGDVYKIDTMHIYLSEVDMEPSGRNLIIPNAFVLTNAIINYTKGSHYIWDNVEIAITYESNWKKAEKLVFEAADDIVGEDMRRLAKIWESRPRQFAKNKTNPKPMIRISLFENGIKIKVRYLVNSLEWALIKTQITQRILEKIGPEPDVNIAYPHMEVIYDEKNNLYKKLENISKKNNNI
ncbi:mechanosensitive ion channel family protein [Methanococcus aeolicus]|uniref:mechanosensitive ion channel family protein n=1 Tax=Methanococcus aeolicus TaxID=42879 RepID=UPI0021CAB5B3|nr:mechanosensitive ion channel family protein [Methanococcus aeolicus]UXM85376.1 mechanosensitive ion channel family protein [Methanococcus aeolicus]